VEIKINGEIDEIEKLFDAIRVSKEQLIELSSICDDQLKSVAKHYKQVH